MSFKEKEIITKDKYPFDLHKKISREIKDNRYGFETKKEHRLFKNLMSLYLDYAYDIENYAVEEDISFSIKMMESTKNLLFCFLIPEDYSKLKKLNKYIYKNGYTEGLNKFLKKSNRT